jgi:hypothetical protein
MFALRSVTALDIAQRWVCFHDTCRDQVVQAEQVFIVAQAVEVPPAEG